jgi:TRAP-type transport system periplasmic protein
MALGTRRTLRPAAVIVSTLLLFAACGGDDADEPAATDDVDETEVEEEAEDAPAEDMGDPVTLNLAHPFPAGHLIQVNVLEPFVEQVAEATDGTVTIEIHPAEALTAPGDAYDNAAAGAIDIGWALHGYTPGRFPLTDSVELPFLFENAGQATTALWDLYDEFPELQDEYGDVHVLGLWTHDVGNLYVTDTAVTEPDLSGLTLRAPGPIQTNLIEALGGAGVGLPAPELYDSLERGVIDGLMIADTGVDSFTLYEVVDHATIANFYVAGQFLVMNQGAWDSLSDAQQQAIDGLAGRDLSLTAAGAYDDAHARVVGQHDEWGLEIVNVDDLAPWQAAAQSVVDDWISAREADGLPGQQMYDRLLEITGN